MRSGILVAMDELAEEYGDICRLRFGVADLVFVRGGEAVNRILVTNQNNYVKSRQFDLFRPILGDGMVTSSGATWKRSRRLVGPLFAKRHLGAYADHMSSAATDAVDRWDAAAVDGSVVDLDREMLRIGLDTVFRALVSHDVADVSDDLGSAFGAALHEIGRISRSPGPMLLQDVSAVGIVRAAVLFTPRRWRRYTALAHRVDTVIGSLVDERLRAGHAGRDDLLTLLVDGVDPDTGERLSRQQIVDEVKTLIAAGHETTAHGLAWMFRLVGEQPAVRDRLEEELNRVLAGRRPGISDVDDLRWLTACFCEAMRLYPPVWHIPRVAMADDVIDGRRIAAGSRVMVNVWSTHRDERIYPNATEFRPQRWLDDGVPRHPRNGYLPFGAGRRACVGQSFAMVNAVLLGAVVAQRYHFEAVPGSRISLEPTITLRPYPGIPATARRRVS
jgi:cytochrome P450